MAIPNLALVDILRETADRIEAGADYQWSHFGKCNCGHLAQTATRLSAVQIHRNAFCRFAEWSEIPDDFCPQTGVLIDRVVDTLFELGINASDLRHLEDLTDGEVLRNLPGGVPLSGTKSAPGCDCVHAVLGESHRGPITKSNSRCNRIQFVYFRFSPKCSILRKSSHTPNES